jgi:hypothetical protein
MMDYIIPQTKHSIRHRQIKLTFLKGVKERTRMPYNLQLELAVQHVADVVLLPMQLSMWLRRTGQDPSK